MVRGFLMSSHLPVVSGAEAVKAFTKAGFVLMPGRGKGSHIVLHHSVTNKLLTVPNHRPVRRGTLRALIRDAGLTVDQFRDLL
jgi:predicted RNA binding protein YcfA (HicA-like mRNA interferase family)